MVDKRLDRALDTREKSSRKRAWVRPEVLPSPTPEEGYTFHWVRISTQGQPDPTNVSSKLREGWEPVKAIDHPEIQLVSLENERFKDKAPVELVAERSEYYEKQASAQVQSVDNNLMRENDPRMPLFNERTTKVTSFGKG